MIQYDEFGKLRLAHFVPPEEVSQLDKWEFEGRLWIGEAIGFSEWLCLKDDPDRLRSLALDFSGLQADVVNSIIQKLQLPCHAGMLLSELDAQFGKRINEYRFANDQLTVEYLSPGPNSYHVSCTVLESGGLSYVVVMVPCERE